MAMKKVLGGVVLLFFLATATISMAMPASQYKPIAAIAATPVALGADVNNLVFTGTVTELPGGTALVTSNATYRLLGGNFQGIVGKEVNIIGRVIEDGAVKKIKVARAQLALE